MLVQPDNGRLQVRRQIPGQRDLLLYPLQRLAHVGAFGELQADTGAAVSSRGAETVQVLQAPELELHRLRDQALHILGCSTRPGEDDFHPVGRLAGVELHGQLAQAPEAGQYQHDHQQVGGQGMASKGGDQVVWLGVAFAAGSSHVIVRIDMVLYVTITPYSESANGGGKKILPKAGGIH